MNIPEPRWQKMSGQMLQQVLGIGPVDLVCQDCNEQVAQLTCLICDSDLCADCVNVHTTACEASGDADGG